MRSRVPHDSYVALARDAVCFCRLPSDSSSLGVLLLPLRSHCRQLPTQHSNDACTFNDSRRRGIRRRLLPTTSAFEIICRTNLRQAENIEPIGRN